MWKLIVCMTFLLKMCSLTEEEKHWRHRLVVELMSSYETERK